MTRAEFDWSEVPYPSVVSGTSEAVGASPDSDHVAAVLWVPDPEQRHGWREVYIDKPQGKPRVVGFRKPGGRS